MDGTGSRIKETRLLMHLTQNELASKVGISQNFLSEIENNKYDIKLSLLYDIAQALETCPGNLIASCENCKIHCRAIFFNHIIRHDV